MKVTSVLPIYEVDDKETPASERDRGLIVESHWNRDRLVVLQMPDGQRVTVEAAALKRATDNAANWR